MKNYRENIINFGAFMKIVNYHNVYDIKQRRTHNCGVEVGLCFSGLGAGSAEGEKTKKSPKIATKNINNKHTQTEEKNQ